MVIAVDGPAGAGKSTVCRLLAERLGYTYLDTGSMYRAAAWGFIQEGLRSEEEFKISMALDRLPLHFCIENGSLTILYGEKRLDEEIRPPEISRMASRVSQLSAVREFMMDWQRRLAEKGNVVAEGRDMGTVVFPETPFKIYLTADLATRARRRFLEYQSKRIPVEYAALEEQIRERDKADEERALAPLRPSPEAFVLDTSDMSISDVVDRVLEHIREKEEWSCQG